MINNITIIGSGNVGTHLAIALIKAGKKIDCIYSRKLENARLLADKTQTEAINDFKKLPENSDLYLICVSDDAIKEVVESINLILGKEKMIAHSSGSTCMSVFSGNYINYGVFYPLQTFSKTREVDMTVVPFFISASDKFVSEQFKQLAQCISQKVEIINDKQRLTLHIAAVFSNNFSNHLFRISAELLENSGLDFDHLRPLIKETAAKVQEGHPKDMQTGPAKRDDISTLKKHLRYLKSKPTYKKLYKVLSRGIRKDEVS